MLINAAVACLQGAPGYGGDGARECSLEGSGIRFLHLCVICGTPPSSVKDHPGVRSVNYRSFDVIEHRPVEIDYSLS